MKKILLFLKINKVFNLLRRYKMEKNQEKRSELKLTIAVSVFQILSTIMGYIPPELTAKLLVVLNSIYIISRTIVKITKTKKDDEIIDLIEKILKQSKSNYDTKENS